MARKRIRADRETAQGPGVGTCGGFARANGSAGDRRRVDYRVQTKEVVTGNGCRTPRLSSSGFRQHRQHRDLQGRSSPMAASESSYSPRHAARVSRQGTGFRIWPCPCEITANPMGKLFKTQDRQPEPETAFHPAGLGPVRADP